MPTLWKESYDKSRQYIKKQRHHFADEGPYVRAVGFPVVVCECESGTVKKVEQQRTDAFELWCWRRLLRAPWTARKSNQSILKEINSEDSLEALMLELKLWYFGHLVQRANSSGKDPDAGKDRTQKESRVAEDKVVR